MLHRVLIAVTSLVSMAVLLVWVMGVSGQLAALWVVRSDESVFIVELKDQVIALCGTRFSRSDYAVAYAREQELWLVGYSSFKAGYAKEVPIVSLQTRVPCKSCWVSFPVWVLLVISVYPGISFIRGFLRRRLRKTGGRCVVCGYTLAGNMSGICPECGTPITRIPT